MATLPPEVLASIASKRLGIQSQHDTALQQAAQGYNTNLYNLDQYAKDTGKRINDQYASQGLFSSGIRVNEQGRLQQNVGERKGFLGQQYAGQQSGIEGQYQNALSDLQQYQATAMQDATRQELAQQQNQAQMALQQRQIDAQNAATMQAAAAQQQQQAPAAAPAAQGPDQASIDYWNAVQYLNAVKLWNATQLWNQAMQSQNRTEFAGSGNPLGMAGARFK
jgi:hypothetical protein